MQRLMTVRSSLKVLGAAVFAAVIVAGTVAVTAGATGANPTYYACLSGGDLSSVATTAPTCTKPAKLISWNQTGPQGAAGNTILSGAGTPPTTIGVAGNFYLETSNHTLYGPATHTCNPLPCRTNWGSGTSLVGPGGFVYETTAGDVTGAGGANTTVLTQTVPVGGDFSVAARVEGVNSGENYATTWVCSLDAANPGHPAVTLDTNEADGDPGGAGTYTPVSLQGVVSLAAHGTITIHCEEDNSKTLDYYTNPRIATTLISGFSIVPPG